MNVIDDDEWVPTVTGIRQDNSALSGVTDLSKSKKVEFLSIPNYFFNYLINARAEGF